MDRGAKVRDAGRGVCLCVCGGGEGRHRHQTIVKDDFLEALDLLGVRRLVALNDTLGKRRWDHVRSKVRGDRKEEKNVRIV